MRIQVQMVIFYAMYDWGQRAITLSDQIPPPPRSSTAVAEAWQQMRNELSRIITAFCTAQRPRGGKPEYFTVSRPPEYDPTTLVIGDIIQPNTRTVIILTEEARGNEYEYILKRRGGSGTLISVGIGRADGGDGAISEQRVHAPDF